MTRTRTTTVTFARPFALAGADHRYPAGAYEVQTDEETIDTLSFVAWRRVATTILVHADGATQAVRVEPADLDALRSRDGASTPAAGDAVNDNHAPGLEAGR